MKKIGVISDIHGNLQALQVVLRYLKEQHCDEIIHTGDLMCIGVDSVECLHLFKQNNVLCLLGNHDQDFVNNDTFHRPLSHVSQQHKQYVFGLMKGYENVVRAYPLSVSRICGGKKVVFEHYARVKEASLCGKIFKPFVPNPSRENFDKAYADYDCDVVFFGHKHEACDIEGDKLYVDVGSVACHPEPTACGLIISYDQTHFSYERFALPYNQQEARKAMVNPQNPHGEYLFDFYYLHKLYLPIPF